MSPNRLEIAQFARNDSNPGPETDVTKKERRQLLTIGRFSTGRDEAARQLLQAVQDSIHNRYINGKISFVFSNREPADL